MTGARAFAVEERRRRREAVLQARRPRILIDSREQTPLTFSDAVDVEYGVTQRDPHDGLLASDCACRLREATFGEREFARAMRLTRAELESLSGTRGAKR